MRNALVVLWMLLCSITSAAAQVSIGIEFPGVNLGINVPVYPQLVPVPGYPVYYAPQMSSNYFFYDGLYWVYQRDNWYASSWYNGPWGLVAPEAVPLFVLRVPVRYYRQQPAYFHGWRSDAAPHWGEHWGNTWEQRRAGWDNWNRSAVPPPAPLPVYQRQYSGTRYPRVEQQQVLQSQNYHYQPQDAVVQQHYQAQRMQSAPAPAPRVQSAPAQAPRAQNAPAQAPRVQNAPAPSPQARQAVPQEKGSPQQDQRVSNRQSSSQQGAPQTSRAPPPQTSGGEAQKLATAQQAPPRQNVPAAQQQKQQPQQGAAQHEQQVPKSQGQDKGPQAKGPAQEPKQGQEKGREQGEQRGAERNN